MSRKGAVVLAIALAAALGASTPAAGFKGTDEELARELADHLEELASVADDFSEMEDGGGDNVERAGALVDWLVGTAAEISQRIKAKGDSSHMRHAKALVKATKEAEGELRKYAAGKSSPQVCAETLRDVVEAGGVVVKTLASKQ